MSRFLALQVQTSPLIVKRTTEASHAESFRGETLHKQGSLMPEKRAHKQKARQPANWFREYTESDWTTFSNIVNIRW